VFIGVRCGEAVDRITLGEAVFKRDSVRTCGQCPSFFGWEERKFVLRESLVMHFAASDEFWAVSIPTCMGVGFAGCAVSFVLVAA